MRVFLLAAGDSTRWSLPYPKHLAPIGSELLLERLVRQITSRGHEPVIMTQNKAIKREFPDFVVVPLRRRWTLETFYSTNKLWNGGRVAVLLGDVVLSKALMDCVLSCDEPLRVFGSSSANAWRRMWNEFYGVVFDESNYDYVRSCLFEAIRRAEKLCYAKLITLYQIFCGCPKVCREDFVPPESAIFYDVDDYTSDIDDVKRYNLFVRFVVEGGLLDDLSGEDS